MAVMHECLRVDMRRCYFIDTAAPVGCVGKNITLLFRSKAFLECTEDGNRVMEELVGELERNLQ
jgi:hypothetical protein